MLEIRDVKIRIIVFHEIALILFREELRGIVDEIRRGLFRADGFELLFALRFLFRFELMQHFEILLLMRLEIDLRDTQETFLFLLDLLQLILAENRFLWAVLPALSHEQWTLRHIFLNLLEILIFEILQLRSSLFRAFLYLQNSFLEIIFLRFLLFLESSLLVPRELRRFRFFELLFLQVLLLYSLFLLVLFNLQQFHELRCFFPLLLCIIFHVLLHHRMAIQWFRVVDLLTCQAINPILDCAQLRFQVILLFLCLLQFLLDDTPLNDIRFLRWGALFRISPIKKRFK